MTGSHCLISDLSNDVFFHIFYCHLSKISEIEMLTSDQNTGAGACQKQIKTNNFFFFFSQENYCKLMSHNYFTYPNQNLRLKCCLR